MRITLDLPDELIAKAMKVTRITSTTALVRKALESLVHRECIKDIKKYHGRLHLDIDLDTSRKRGCGSPEAPSQGP